MMSFEYCVWGANDQEEELLRGKQMDSNCDISPENWSFLFYHFFYSF